MNRRLSLVLAVVLLLVLVLMLVLAIPSCGRWWRIDECLDAGGRWNYAQDVCEYQMESLMHREPTGVLDALRAEVHARSEGNLDSLLVELTFGLSGYDKFPEDAFGQYTSLLADPAFWKHEDTWPFVKQVGDSWELFSVRQRETLRPLLIANFDKGTNPMGAFVIGELLGGRYGDQAALDALSNLAGAASMPARAFVPHGLEVLVRETTNAELRRRAVLVLRHLEKSEIDEVRSEASLALKKISVPAVHE